MPNPSETVAVVNQVKPEAPSLVDQYRLGDDLDTGTEVDENAEPESESAVAAKAVKPAAEDTFLPPRGADGKFLPKAEAEKPTLPLRLVRMAEDLGFSEDDLEGATKEQVEDWVYAANKSALKTRKAESLVETRERRKPEGQVPTQTEDANEFDQAIEAGFAPELVDIVRKQASRIDQLEKMVGQLGEFERGRQVETFASKMDDAIDALGMPERFGSGRGKDMDPTSPEYRCRFMLVREVDDDKSKKSLKAKVEAAGALFGFARKPKEQAGQQPAVATPKPTNGHATEEDFEEQWNRSALARPTARNTVEPKGEKKAVSTAREYMRANNMLDDEESSKDGFL